MTMQFLVGKTALVTGGTDGIGAQLIRQLRAKGAEVITTGRNPDRIDATAAAECRAELTQNDRTQPYPRPCCLPGSRGIFRPRAVPCPRAANRACF